MEEKDDEKIYMLCSIPNFPENPGFIKIGYFTKLEETNEKIILQKIEEE